MGTLMTLSTLIAGHVLNAAPAPVSDTPFVQEYREFYLVEGAGANEVAGVAVDGAGAPWIATQAGVYRLVDGAWKAMLPEADMGPAFAAEAGADGSVWLGVWNGLYRGTVQGAVERLAAEGAPIGAIGVGEGYVVAMGPQGMWHNRYGSWRHETGGWANSPRAVVCARDGTVWMPSDHGLFHIKDTEVVRRYHKQADIRSGELADAALAPVARVP